MPRKTVRQVAVIPDEMDVAHQRVVIGMDVAKCAVVKVLVVVSYAKCSMFNPMMGFNVLEGAA